MASTFDKKFKTTETTKAAGAEVVSDPIDLGPRTKNHILTVTTDNSLSGTVDVEMEMSPDGYNWCPAVSRTVSGGATSSTGDVIGNEESVKLTPDAGEFKNKHARGGLNFDVNGNPTTDGAGARDLMHQHISTTKSFNYSQWLKTSEAPTTTYKPVLFRHGGYDNFSNAKTAELTDIDIPGNYYSVKAEDQSYAGSTNTINVTVANNGTSNKFYVDGVSSTGKLRLAEGTTYIFDQSDSSNSGHPLRFSTTSDGSHGGGSEYTTGVTTNGTPGSAGAYTQIVVASSAPTLYTYCTQHSGMGGEVDTVAVMKRPQLKLSNASGTFINPFKKSTDSNPDTLPDISTTDIANNNDVGITISSNVRFTGPQSGTNYNVKRLWTVFLEDSNGNPKGAISTLISKINSNMFNMYYDENWNQIAYYGTSKGSLLDGNWHHISCNFFKQPAGTSHNQGFYSRISIDGATPPQGTSATTNDFQDYDGFKVTKVVLGGGEDYDIDIEYDNLCFYTGWLNTNSNFTNIYNARKNPLSFSSPNMVLKSCFTMGDYSDDRSNHIYKDIVEPSSGRQFVKHDSTSAPVSVALANTDDPYLDVVKTTQNLCEDLGDAINGKAIQTSTSTTNNTRDFISTTASSLFGGTSLPAYNGAWSLSFWVNIPSNGSSFDTILGEADSLETRKHFKIFQLSGNLTFSMAFVNNGLDLSIPFTTYNTWKHITITKASGAPGTSTVNIYVDGSAQTVSATYNDNSPSRGTADNWNTTNDSTITIGGHSWAYNSASSGAYAGSRTGRVFKVDSLAGYSKELSSSEVSYVYNSGNYIDLSTIDSSYNVESYFKFGDYSNDVTTGTIALHDGVGGVGVLGIGTSSDQSIVSLDGTESFYKGEEGLSGDIFTTTSNLSISGWFKTTDTGILFSNSSDGTDGLLFDIQSSVYQLKFGNVVTIQSASSGITDGQWHNLVITKAAKDGSNLTETKIYIDGVLKSTTSVGSNLADSDLKGSNGFTLLSNGENNANATSPASTDTSKLNATLSNWSLHSEVLDANAVKQIHSNGHVRNIKNLPNVTASSIKAWWQLADATNPQNDLIGTNHLQYLKASQTTNTNENYLEGLRLYNSNTIDFEVNTPFNPFSGTYSTAMPNLADDFTISMWVYIDGAASTGAVNLIRIGNNNAKFGIYHGASTRITAYMGSAAGDYNIIGGNPTINPVGSSAHVVARKSGSTLSLWKDGTQVGSVTVNISNTNWGEGNGTVDFFELSARYVSLASGSISRGDKSARISDLAFYNSALSSTDISALASKPGAANTVASSNLKTYFKMGDGPNDDIASELVYDTVNYNSSYYIEDTSSSGNATISSLATSDPAYTDGSVIEVTALNTDLVNSDEATYVNGSINGNAFTMSLTKSFNFTTNEWVSTADQDTALCLSFNGFEEQAEYFALWKCSQTIAGSAIDICDGNWHNVILSYRGKNDFVGDNVDPGDTVKFGPGPANSLPFNWAISYDGQPLTAIKDGSGADYIGGLNTLVTDSYSSTTYNVGFAIQDRHLKYETSNTEEEYKPHAQFSAGIHEVTGVDNNNAFQGYVDETSFHSDCWWVDQAGTSITTNSFNQEKPATIYGNTTALSNRGAGTEYAVGVPYPLLNPEKLTTSGQASDIEGSNQYINPNRYNPSNNPNGGLEGWWRWGDTPGDCSETINDVRDHEDAINTRDIDAFGIVTADRQLMDSTDSIYLASSTASGGGGTTITFPQVKIEAIQQGICNLSNINSPLLQFVRVKIKGAGSMDLGEGKGQARLNYTNRRRRKK